MEERVDELEPAPSYGPDQPAAVQGLQARRALRFVEPGDLGGNVGPETQPEHTGDAGEADPLRREPRKPGEQELLLGVAGGPPFHPADRIPPPGGRCPPPQEGGGFPAERPPPPQHTVRPRPAAPPPPAAPPGPP